MVYLTVSSYNWIFNSDLCNNYLLEDSMRQLQHTIVWKKCQPLVLNCGPETQNNWRENALEIKVLLYKSRRGVRVTILRKSYNALVLKSMNVWKHNKEKKVT